jgi:hypothetical protein
MQENSKKQVASSKLVSRLAHFSILKKETTCFSETPVDFQLNTWRYIPEYRTTSQSQH